MVKFICQLAIVTLLVTTAGCVTQTAQLPLTGNIMVDGPYAIAHGPARDKVLWQYRTAAAAMRRGQFQMAREYLDDALLTLGGIYGPNQSAREARGYFHQESKKTFIGEPYERAMAYYFRGILYWMDGEPDNARACFRSSEIEDSDAVNHEYAGDWVLPDYLAGLASVKLGGDGSDAFQRSEKEARLTKPPPYNAAANALFFINYGPGPRKYAGGEYGEQLRFRVPSSPVQSAVIHVDGQTVAAPRYDDVGFQATTRGGRVMDYVLGNKAVFKSATSAAGDIGIIGGAIAASHRDLVRLRKWASACWPRGLSANSSRPRQLQRLTRARGTTCRAI